MKVKKNFLKNCSICLLVFYVLAGVFYFATGEQLFLRESSNEIVSVEGDFATYEITPEFSVTQKFICYMNHMEGFEIRLATFARENAGNVNIKLIDSTKDEVLYDSDIDVSTLTDSALTTIKLDKVARDVYGDIMEIVISSEEGESGNAVAPWYNSKIVNSNQQLYFNDKPTDGLLCFSTFGKDNVWTGPNYWKIIGVASLLLILYFWYLHTRIKYEKKSLLLTLVETLKKYRFLIKQLVSRDFKIKYKRSVLGAMWSFINPLITMLVQYVVFSTIFKTDIENYPVYLLSGIVLFSFFQEATGNALFAIVGNASLIKKVYVPKYIYPVSKTVSSAVNLLIAMAPLLIMCLITKVQITKAFVLLPFALICLIIFCIGIGFVLSAIMTLFRDIQFIWSVISLVWMYATPIFYPESILPKGFDVVLKINPIYYYIKFFRIVVIDGISPEPIMYLQCALFSIGSLLLGFLVFKKMQNKFVFYL